MPIIKTQGYQLDSPQQNFVRDSFQTLADMLAYDTAMLPSVFHSMVDEDGKMYTYWDQNEEDPVLGKWRLGAGSGQGGDTLNVDVLPDPSTCQEGDIVNLRNDLPPCDDPAKLILGGGWHIATYDEAYQLLAGISWSGLDNYNVTYVEHDFGTKDGVNVTLRLDKTIRTSKNHASIGGIVIGTSELIYRPERGFVDESYTVDGFIETYYYYAGSSPRREFWEITDDPYISTVGEENSYWDKRTKTINYIAVLKDGDDPGPSYQDDYHFWHDSEHGYTIYMTPFKTRWGCEYGDDSSTTYKWSNPDYDPSNPLSEQFLKYGLNNSESLTKLSTEGDAAPHKKGLYRLENGEWVFVGFNQIEYYKSKSDVANPNDYTLYVFEEPVVVNNIGVDIGDPATLVHPLCRSLTSIEWERLRNSFIHPESPDPIEVFDRKLNRIVRGYEQLISDGPSAGHPIFFPIVYCKKNDIIDSGLEASVLLSDCEECPDDNILVGTFGDDDWYIDVNLREWGYSCRAVITPENLQYLPTDLRDKFEYLPSVDLYMYVLPVGGYYVDGSIYSAFGGLYQFGDTTDKYNETCDKFTYKYYDADNLRYTQYFYPGNIDYCKGLLGKLWTGTITRNCLYRYDNSHNIFLPYNMPEKEPLNEESGGTGCKSIAELGHKVWNILERSFTNKSTFSDFDNILLEDKKTTYFSTLFSYIKTKITALFSLVLESASASDMYVGVKNSAGNLLLRINSTTRGLYCNNHAKWILRNSPSSTVDVITDYQRLTVGQDTDATENRAVVRNSLCQIEMVANASGNMGLYDRTHNQWIAEVTSADPNTLVSMLPTIKLGNSSKASDVQYQLQNDKGTLALVIGHDSGNKGIYDTNRSSWMFFKDTSDKLHIGGDTVGSASMPIYLNGGVPTACTSIPSAPAYYRHSITLGGGSNNTSIRCTIIRKSNTAFTISTLASFLYGQGNTSSTTAIPASGYYYPGKTAFISGLYATYASGTYTIYAIARSTTDTTDSFPSLATNIGIVDTVRVIS